MSLLRNTSRTQRGALPPGGRLRSIASMPTKYSYVRVLYSCPAPSLHSFLGLCIIGVRSALLYGHDPEPNKPGYFPEGPPFVADPPRFRPSTFWVIWAPSVLMSGDLFNLSAKGNSLRWAWFPYRMYYHFHTNPAVVFCFFCGNISVSLTGYSASSIASCRCTYGTSQLSRKHGYCIISQLE